MKQTCDRSAPPGIFSKNLVMLRQLMDFNNRHKNTDLLSEKSILSKFDKVSGNSMESSNTTPSVIKTKNVHDPLMRGINVVC
jgi:hypothetical protein